MREVAASLFGFICRVLERYGVDSRPHMQGLDLAEVDPSRLGERVHWDELALFLNRCAASLEPQEQEALGELYPFEHRYMHFAAQTLRSPRQFYRLLTPLTQAALPHMQVRGGVEDDGRLSFTFELPQRYAPCPLFFAANTGEFRALTELWGLGRSEVEADVGGWHGHYLIRLPDEPQERAEPGVAWPEQLLQSFANLIRWIVTLDVPSGKVDAERLRREHGLSWLEAHVALQLARGEGMVRAAANLGLSVESLQSHLRTLQTKLSPSAPEGESTGARERSEGPDREIESDRNR